MVRIPYKGYALLHPIGILKYLYYNLIRRMGICKIIDNLYIGELSDAVNKTAIQNENIVFVVDVRPHFSPMADSVLPSLRDLVDGIILLIDNNYPVMVYCRGGIDRSPFTATIIVKFIHGCTWDEAWEIVSKGRPQAFRHYEWEQAWGKLLEV
jgi:protein-tyrosine phosphatase